MNGDKLGIMLSGFCAVHCLLFSAAIALLPLLPVSASVHAWTHPIFFVLIVPTVIYALRKSTASLRVVLPLVSGTIVVGIAWIWHGPDRPFLEAGLTLVGSMLLIWGHWINYRELLALNRQAC